MNKRPRSVTVLSCLMIAVGAVGLARDVAEFNPEQPFQYDHAWIWLIHFTAIICGVFMLRGRNWARWIVLAWMAFHVIVGGLHSWNGLVTHALLFAMVAYVLFCPQATDYFRAASSEAT
jgi:hypothetical protein